MVNLIKLLSFTTSVAVSIYLIKRYFAGGVCKHNTDLTGKVVIVTGGSSGIGREIATGLAKRGAKVVIAYRGQTNYQSFPADWIILDIEFLYLDLRSFSSIREFSHIIHDRFDSVYALVNNAAVFYESFYETEDEFDVTFQTNYLGPFLLTYLLLDLVRASPDGGRIVNVTCETHFDLHNLDPRVAHDLGRYSHNRYTAYAVSKACLQLFTHKLSLSLTDCEVTVNDVNPGNVRTNLLNRYLKETYYDYPFPLKLLAPLRWLVTKSPAEGAQTPLHVILSPDLRGVTDKYFSDCKERVPSPLCRNDRLAHHLWMVSLALVNRGPSLALPQ